jgi:hypothetical protein
VLREANFKFTFVGKLDTDKRFLFYWSPRLLPVIYRLLIVSQNAAKNCRYRFFTQSSVLPQIMSHACKNAINVCKNFEKSVLEIVL